MVSFDFCVLQLILTEVYQLILCPNRIFRRANRVIFTDKHVNWYVLDGGQRYTWHSTLACINILERLSRQFWIEFSELVFNNRLHTVLDGSSRYSLTFSNAGILDSNADRRILCPAKSQFVFGPVRSV